VEQFVVFSFEAINEALGKNDKNRKKIQETLGCAKMCKIFLKNQRILNLNCFFFHCHIEFCYAKAVIESSFT
jgi:hypothetical protein